MYKEKIDSSKSISRQLPVNITDKDRSLFEHELVYQLPELHIIVEADVEISKGCIVKNSQGNVLADFSIDYHKEGIVDKLKKKLVSIFIKKIVLDSEYYWVIDGWSGGYSHWVTDALPRLMCLIEKSGPGKVILPASYKHISFIVESLQVFNCSIEFIDESKIYLVKKLITHSYLAVSGNYNPEVIKKLSAKIKNEAINTSKEEKLLKLYISREKAAKRKVLNEEAVRNLFISYGFKVVYMEDYTFNEKVNLLSKAQIVASIHGAGLTNMIFMPENSSILEFRKKGDALNNCFFSLSAACNIKYYYLEDSGTAKSIDMEIDIPSLEETIISMM